MAKKIESLQELKTASVENTEAKAPRKSVKDKFGRTYATGKRKDAVARVWIKPGKGVITVNEKSLDEYFARPVLKMVINQPFVVTNRENEFDVVCTVKGGGLSGQAGAIKHGISKALNDYEPELRTVLKQAGFLTRDDRVVEGGVNVGDAFRHNLSDLLTSTLRSSLLRIIASHTCPLLLLERHTDLTRAFAGASIRTSALTAAGKTLAVTHTTISAKVDQSLDRELNFATEVAFNRKLADLIADLFKISVSEILDLLGKFDAAIRQNFTSARTADAINGSETDFGMLLRRNINTGDTSHFLPL